MALQVWLPLNKEGDFQNRGLANITATNNGATYNSSGKIGGCYTFGNGSTSSNGVNINNNFTNIGTSRSICAWVNPKGNHLHYSGAIVSSGDWNTSCWGFCLKQDNTGITGFDGGYSNYFTAAIPTNTWTHLCVTVVDNVTKFYKNGEYLGESSRGTAFTSDANNTMIGRETYASGYFSFNGDISDVRIYDHCLSPKEVKEISKALVLHYPLNDTYITQSTTIYDCSGYSNNGTLIGSLSCIDDSPKYNVSTQVSNGNNINFNFNPSFITTGSISFWAKYTSPGSAGTLPFTGQSGSYYIMACSSAGSWYNGTVSGTLAYYKDGVAATNPRETSEWHHFVITGINLSSWTAIYLNRYGSDSSSWNSTAQFSDIRIYNTVLSADDIKELYSTSCIITNQ